MENLNGYSAQVLIDQKQAEIKVLEGIIHFEMLKKCSAESVKRHGIDRESREKYRDEIELYDSCINRLNLRYQNTVAKMPLFVKTFCKVTDVESIHRDFN